MSDRAIRATESYYTRAILKHGPSARGVDWNTEESQNTRFGRLISPTILECDEIVDLGCGYGALLEYLRGCGWTGRYQGVDLVPAMVDAARKRNATDSGATFVIGTAPPGHHQVVIANGILNVRGALPVSLWRRHVHKTLEAMFEAAEVAIAFNFLHPWSDPAYKRRHLWYPRGFELVDFTIRRYSRWIEMDQAYGLFETTVRAYRNTPGIRPLQRESPR